MLSSFYKAIASGFGRVKRIFTSSDASAEALSKQKLNNKKAITALVKVISYALIPLHIVLLLLIAIFYAICHFSYRGISYVMRGLKAIVSIIVKGMAAYFKKLKIVISNIGTFARDFLQKIYKLIKDKMKILDFILLVLGKGLLILIVPPLFLILLVIILLSKICPYVYKWIAYGVTALRIILTFIGEKRSPDESDLIKTIESSGFSYDRYQNIFYSNMDSWQRKFGYCRLYDEAAAVWGMIVDCEPIYLEYEGKKWLIEFWKGQYDLTMGCEIGVYTTEGPFLDIPGVLNGTFYNSADDTDLLKMSCSLKKNGKLLFTRKDEHWWLTGFILGEFSKPSELIMDIKITLKDKAMCNLFVKELIKAGYLEKEIVINENEVDFCFSKPKTPQPITRTKITDWIIQKKNKYMCKKFQKITGSNNTMEEKLAILQKKAPKLYSKITNIGKSQKLYEKCSSINKYFN